MDTNVYFIQACDPNGENLDLIVSGKSPERAMKLWQQYYAIDSEGREKYHLKVYEIRQLDHEYIHSWDLLPQVGFYL